MLFTGLSVELCGGINHCEIAVSLATLVVTVCWCQCQVKIAAMEHLCVTLGCGLLEMETINRLNALTDNMHWLNKSILRDYFSCLEYMHKQQIKGTRNLQI